MMFLARNGQSLADLEAMETDAIAFWAQRLKEWLEKEREQQEEQQQKQQNGSRG